MPTDAGRVNSRSTRHASLVTRHPSPVTRHPPPVTRHPSPVTRHPSPVTRHPPPATRHPSPVTRHPPPVTRHPPPATRHPPRRLRVFSLDNFFCPARESLQFPFHHACARISCFRKKAATELNKHSRNHGLRGGHGPPETLPGYRVRRRGEPHGISHASQLPDSG
jgi:hypothetical protein